MLKRVTPMALLFILAVAVLPANLYALSNLGLRISSVNPDPAEVKKAYTVSVFANGALCSVNSCTYGFAGAVIVVSNNEQSCQAILQRPFPGAEYTEGSCSLISSTVGDKTITASFSCSPCYYFDPTSQSRLLSVLQKQSPLIVSASSSEIVVGQTAILSVSGGSGDGTVTYQVVDGIANCSIYNNTLAGSASGTCSVVAYKARDATYLPITSEAIAVTVRAKQATLTVTVTPSSLAVGSVSALSSTGGSGSGTVTYQVVAGGGRVLSPEQRYGG